MTQLFSAKKCVTQAISSEFSHYDRRELMSVKVLGCVIICIFKLSDIITNIIYLNNIQFGINWNYWSEKELNLLRNK